MRSRRISPWQWATVFNGLLAVTAIWALALMLGRDTVMTIGAGLVLCLLAVGWMVSA